MDKNTDTTTWTDKQWAAYRMLTERAATRTLSLSNGTPKGGWTETDKIIGSAFSQGGYASGRQAVAALRNGR